MCNAQALGAFSSRKLKTDLLPGITSSFNPKKHFDNKLKADFDMTGGVAEEQQRKAAKAQQAQIDRVNQQTIADAPAGSLITSTGNIKGTGQPPLGGTLLTADTPTRSTILT